MKLVLFLTLPLYLLDQATKWLVLRFIGTEDTVPIIPRFFNLVQVHNTGAAFGMLKDNNLFFVALATAALVALAYLAKRGAFTDTPTRIGAALLVSGILGNVTDRLVHGFVIDFLDEARFKCIHNFHFCAEIYLKCKSYLLVFTRGFYIFLFAF